MNSTCSWILKHTRVWSWDSHWMTKRTPPWAITLVQLQDIKQLSQVWSLLSWTNLYPRHGCEKCSLRMSEEFQLKDLLLLWYYYKVFDTLSEFKWVNVKHIWREHNAHVDLLSKLASTKKKNHHHLVIQQTILVPSIDNGKYFSTSGDEMSMISI